MHPESVAATSHDPTAVRLNGLRAALRERATSFVGTLAFVAGEAELHDPLTARPRAVEAGIRLGRGTTLTVRAGRALVRLDDGSDVWLAAGATLDLSPWGESVRAVRLAAGRAMAFVAREAGRPFRTLTAAGTIHVTGTAFEADAREGALDVAVLHGSVEIATGAGRVAVSRGRAVSARANEAPRVTRLGAADRDRWSWLGDASASSTNERIRPAYAAAARTLGLPPAPRREKTQMDTNMKRFVTAVVVLGLVAGGAAWWFAGSSSTPQAAPGIAAAPAGAPAGQPQFERKMESRAQIALKLDDGTLLTVDPTNPDEIAKVLAKVPAAEREEVKKILDNVIAKHGARMASGGTWNDDGRGGSGDVPLPKGHDNIVRDVEAGRKAMEDLIKGGMTPEQAKAVVEASMADSIRAQVQAEHPGANVQVNVGGAGDNRSEVMIFVGDESKATEDEVGLLPPPPAGGGGK